MPTIEELGQKVKAKYPGQYDDLSDADLGKKVQAKYPDAYKDFGGFSKPKSQTASQRESKKRIADTLMQQSAEQQKSGALAAKGQFAGEMASAIPAALMAPESGGASLMGAGAAGGLARIVTEKLTGSLPDSKMAVAATFALDTVAPAAGKQILKGVGSLVKTVIPKLLVRATAKSAEGLGTLATETTRTNLALNELARNSGIEVDTRPTLLKASEKFFKLNTSGRGSFGATLTGLSDTARALWGDIVKDLRLTAGDISTTQNLDSLIAMKGKLNQVAWHDAGLARGEKGIFMELAKGLDTSIRENLAKIGPEGGEMFDRLNWLHKVQVERSSAVDMAGNFLKNIARRPLTVGGAALGASYGASPSDRVRHAAEGAVAGAAIQHIVPAVSNLILERVFSNPEATKVMGKAIDAFLSGKKSEAGIMAARSFGLVGSGEVAKMALTYSDKVPVEGQPSTNIYTQPK